MQFDKNLLKIALIVVAVIIIARIVSGRKTLNATAVPETYEAMPLNDFNAPLSSGAATQSPQMTTQIPQMPDVSAFYTSPPTMAPMGPLSTSADLLPKISKNQGDWGEFAPAQALAAQSFVDSTKFIGIDTQGSSLRNASHDLRRDPPIPRSDNVSPWLTSTIEPDLSRKALDC
jgi:hypothetical protein